MVFPPSVTDRVGCFIEAAVSEHHSDRFDGGAPFERDTCTPVPHGRGTDIALLADTRGVQHCCDETTCGCLAGNGAVWCVALVRDWCVGISWYLSEAFFEDPRCPVGEFNGAWTNPSGARQLHRFGSSASELEITASDRGNLRGDCRGFS